MDIAVYVVIFLVCVIPNVMIHEFGHLFASRLTGVQVTKMVIGAGPTVLRWRDNFTSYALAALPLGAFCDIDKDHCRSQAGFKQTVVALGGSTLNFLTAFLVLLAVAPFDSDTRPVVQIQPGSPAHLAGLQNQDVIVSVDGVSVSDWQNVGTRLLYRVGDSGELEFITERDGRHFDHRIPIERWESDTRQIDMLRNLGIRHADEPVLAQQTEFAKLGNVVTDTATFMWSMVVSGIKMILGEMSILNYFSGTLFLSMLGEDTTNLLTSSDRQALTWITWAKFFALLTIGLGIINLLTGPLVDGSNAISGLCSMLKSSPISDRSDKAITIFGAIPGWGPLFLCIGYEINRIVSN